MDVSGRAILHWVIYIPHRVSAFGSINAYLGNLYSGLGKARFDLVRDGEVLSPYESVIFYFEQFSLMSRSTMIAEYGHLRMPSRVC